MVKQKKVKNICEKKMWKIFGLKKSKNKKKWSLGYKGYASAYNGEILNSFNHELQLKVLNLQLKVGFKFAMTLVLQFQKIETDNETKYNYLNKIPITWIQKQKQLSWLWWYIWINLEYSYIKHTKVSWKRFRSDYWSRPCYQYFKIQTLSW